MKTYPLFKVHIDKKSALKHMANVFDSGFINEGSQVTELTNALQQRFQTNKLILVNSCTSALTLALRLSGVADRDDVISTPMTCVATNCPIVNAGSDVVWADIDPETGCIDPSSVEEVVKNDPEHKAIIAVAWAGNPPELNDLRKISDSIGARLILDAAHAFGAQYDGADISTVPDFTCYSFQAIKHITTGDGGMLIVKSESDWLLSKKLKWFGIDRDAAKDENGNWKGQHWDFDIQHAGYKFNMNNMAAALGLSQLPHVDRILSAHKENAALFSELLDDSPFLKPLKVPKNAESAHWVYTVLLNDDHKNIRDELLKKLNAEGIMAGLVHVPNDSYTCFTKFKKPLPGVTNFFERQLSLPVGWWLKRSDIKHIARRVNVICKELKR